MILDTNMKIIKKKYENLLPKINKVIASEITIHVQQSKKKQPTMIIDKGNYQYPLCSQYDTQYEAECIINSYTDIHQYEQVLFYGVGMGHHIDVFAQKYPNMDYVIYEPVKEIMVQYLSHRKVDRNPIQHLKAMATNEQNMINWLNSTLTQDKKKLLLIVLPAYRTIFPEAYQTFQQSMKHYISAKRSSYAVEHAFQKRWTINSMVNIKEILNSTNLLEDKPNCLKDKPVIIVAAGPSLDEEIANLKTIKQNGAAYIFSVGSSINALIAQGIHPHATITYDPTVKNQEVFKKIKEQNIGDIPLVFGSSVGFEVLQHYPGNKLHMATSQDTVSSYYLQSAEGKPLRKVADAPSIAIIALQLVYYLGCRQIVLVGQNLAYKNNTNFAKGIDFQRLDNIDDQNLPTVKTVDGSLTTTSKGFNSMRKNMEAYLAQMVDATVINTTQGGAAIEHTTFMPLEQVMTDILMQKQIIDEDLFQLKVNNYNLERLKQQQEKMLTARDEWLTIIKQLNAILTTIREKADENIMHNLEAHEYPQLDKRIVELGNNDFFNAFLLPMSRLYKKLLEQENITIKKDKNPSHKAKAIVKVFGDYLNVCIADYKQIQPLFNQMNEQITQKIQEI